MYTELAAIKVSNKSAKRSRRLSETFCFKIIQFFIETILYDFYQYDAKNKKLRFSLDFSRASFKYMYPAQRQREPSV